MPSIMLNKIERKLVVVNETKNLKLLRNFVTEVSGEMNVPLPERNKIILAVDEAVSNIIEHAYDSSHEGKSEVEVILLSEPDKVVITIKDSGREFDPTEIEDPDIRMHVNEGRKNGLGIFLMRQIMDEVKYTFRAGVENQLVMVKYFKDEGEDSPGKDFAE
ncbi:MAG: ATP-binding protein [Planctomycetota bacterium]|nr:MAG: ATP-binding protein [Planctomycetota bacterium]